MLAADFYRTGDAVGVARALNRQAGSRYFLTTSKFRSSASVQVMSTLSPTLT